MAVNGSSQSDVQYREGYGAWDNYSNELHVSPDLAPLEPLLEARPGRAGTRRVGRSGNRRSVGREAFRLIVYGLIITAIGGAAFASQYGDDKIKETLGILQRTVSGLSPVLGANPSARAFEGFSKSSDQVSAPDKMSAKEARLIQSTPVSAAAGSSVQIQQQLEAMASELAIVRGLAEQLTVSQKKMAQDIAALETAKENISQKVWWLYQSSAFEGLKCQAVSRAHPLYSPSNANQPITTHGL